MLYLVDEVPRFTFLFAVVRFLLPFPTMDSDRPNTSVPSANLSACLPYLNPDLSTSTAMPRKGRKRQGRSSTPAFPKSQIATIVDKLGNRGLVLLLFETPSGFAIFNIDGIHLFLPKAEENIWSNFVKDYMTHRVIWLKEFKTFKNKSNAFNHTGINSELAQMIKKWHLPGQLLAVGKQEHKTIIEQKLKISCLFNEAVMEVMWGIKHLMKSLVPQEKSELPMEERLQMSYGLKTVLNRHGFNVKPEMVNGRIIDAACVLYDCDLCETKHSDFLLSAGVCLMEVSGIAYQGWSLMKIATALKVLSDPENEVVYDDPESTFSKDKLLRLKTDARLYDGKLLKRTCVAVYNEIVWAREVKADAVMLLNILVHEDEDEHAGMPENSVPPGRGGSSSDPSVLEVEKQVVHEAGHAGMPENPPMPPGRAESVSEPAVQEVKQEVV